MVHIYNDPDTLLTALADFVVGIVRLAVDGSGRCNLVLSGGSSPRRLYELLAAEPYRDAVSWRDVYFFFGDERYVPSDDANSNFLMANKTLFLPLDIASEQVFSVNTNLSPADAAHDYERRIRQHFGGDDCRFDLILLGLGDNAHTASLFPRTTVLHEHTALVKEVFVDEVNMYRITFTAPLINAARHVAFLVYGASKAAAVHHILEDAFNAEVYPAQLIKPMAGPPDWFLDAAAAGRISHDG